MCEQELDYSRIRSTWPASLATAPVVTYALPFEIAIPYGANRSPTTVVWLEPPGRILTTDPVGPV